MKRILFAAVLAFIPAPVPFDLDVEVPPGTPLEWTRELKTPTPAIYRGAVPTERSVEDGERGTRAVGIDFGTLNPLGVSRITTRDLPGHLTWTVPTPTKGAGERTPTPSGAITWDYPPAVTHLQWWWCMAILLRTGMHPNPISESEVANLLLEIGEPARVAAEAVAGQGLCPELVALVKKEVSTVPAAKPEVPVMDAPVWNMIARLAVEELTSDYPLGMNPYFAQRLMSLGDAAIPVVMACARSKHTFLQRNSVAILAQYSKPEILAFLRDLMVKTTDLVVRTRAALGVARQQDREAVPALLKWMDEKDRLKSTLAVYCLGLIGHPDAGAPLLKKMRDRMGDSEFLLTAVPALARIRLKGENQVDDLKALVAGLSAGNKDAKAEFRPDQPDPPGLRALILKQFGLLALAAQGDATAVAQAAGKRDWNPTVMYVALETLYRMGAAGQAPLRLYADNVRLEPMLRAMAYVYASMPPDAAYARRVVTEAGDSKGYTGYPPGVRGIALSQLATVDVAAARELGGQILAQYLAKKLREPAEAYLVTTAIQSLGKAGEIEVDKLIELLSAALEQRKAFEVLRKKKKTPVEEWRNQWQQEVEIVIDAPLLESVVIELGRSKSKKAAEVLVALLADPGMEARAEVMLALGAIGGRTALKALVAGLEDKDPWVRWNSFTGLKSLTHRDQFVDWMYGDPIKRSDAVQNYKKDLGL